MSIDKIQELILAKIEAKYWDFPKRPNKMFIASYDLNDNPLIVEYYFDSRLLFTHHLVYDLNGRLTEKKIIVEN